MVDTGNWFVGRNNDYRQLVDLEKLVFLGLSCTCHASQLVVHTEVVLEGNGCQSLGLTANLQALLSFNSLMQTIGITAAIHKASGKLVNNDDFSVLDHIVTIPLHQSLCSKGSHKAVGHFHIFRVIHILQTQYFLNLWHSTISRRYGFGLFIYGVVLPLLQLLYSLSHADIGISGLGARTGNNQRSSGLINEDAVHLIHDGIVQVPLHHLIHIYYHVVTEVVKAKFIIGAKGNIATVGKFTLRKIHIMADQSNSQSQEVIETSHFDAVTLGQIVIDGNNVHTLASQGIQICRQGSNQGLAFTSTHLCNFSLVETNTSHHLHVKMPHAHDTAGSLTNHCKSLWQDII